MFVIILFTLNDTCKLYIPSSNLFNSIIPVSSFIFILIFKLSIKLYIPLNLLIGFINLISPERVKATYFNLLSNLLN